MSSSLSFNRLLPLPWAEVELTIIHRKGERNKICNGNSQVWPVIQSGAACIHSDPAKKMLEYLSGRSTPTTVKAGLRKEEFSPFSSHWMDPMFSEYKLSPSSFSPH